MYDEKLLVEAKEKFLEYLTDMINDFSWADVDGFDWDIYPKEFFKILMQETSLAVVDLGQSSEDEL